MTSFLSTIIKKPSFSRGNSGGKVDMVTTVTTHALPSGPPPGGKTTKTTTTTTTTTKALPLLTLNTDPNALTRVQSSASSAWSPQSAIEPQSAVSYTGSATPTITAATTHTPSSRPRADGSSSKPEITTQRFMPLEFNVYSAPSKRPFSSSTGSSSSPATSSPIVAKLASANPFSSSSSSSAIPAAPSTPTTTTRVPEPTHHIGPHRKDRLFGITEAHNSLRLGPGQAFLTLHDGLRGSDPPLGTVVNAYSVVAAEEKARVDRERAKAQKKQDRKDLKGMSKEDKALDKERVKGEKERRKQEKRDAVDALELERSRTAETVGSHGGGTSGGEETLGTGFWDAFAISVMAYDGDVSGLLVTETLRAVHVGTKFEPRALLRFSMDAASAYAPDSSELTRGRQRRKSSSGSGGSNEQGATEASGAVVVALPRQEFEWYEAFTPVPGPGYEPQSEGWKLARLVSLSNGSKKRGEPLAVCVPNSRSRNKALRFEFVGKGKIAGKYGVSWELMAIMTGLAVCHRLAEISGSVG